MLMLSAAAQWGQLPHHGHCPCWAKLCAGNRERKGDAGSAQGSSREGMKPCTLLPGSAAIRKHSLRMWRAALLPNTALNCRTHLKMKPAPALCF